VVPEKSFDETDYTNDTSSMEIIPFVAGIHPEDTTVFRNNPVQIMASVTGNQSYHFTWEPSSSLSCTDCLTPVATPPYSIAYAFIARNEFGCTDTLYANIKTFAGGRVDIPNAFTPNGDGNNDVFYILGSQDIQSIRNFSIFNRVGQKIFGVENVPANDPRFGWNGSFSGRLAPPETYVYFAIIRFTDGTEQQFKGTVILVR
jgi:gliding motility-associated-like protein